MHVKRELLYVPFDLSKKLNQPTGGTLLMYGNEKLKIKKDRNFKKIINSLQQIAYYLKTLKLKISINYFLDMKGYSTKESTNRC